MKVYIVIDQGVPYQDDQEIKKVFSTKEKGETYMKEEELKNKKYYMETYNRFRPWDKLNLDIEEWEIE